MPDPDTLLFRVYNINLTVVLGICIGSWFALSSVMTQLHCT